MKSLIPSLPLAKCVVISRKRLILTVSNGLILSKQLLVSVMVGHSQHSVYDSLSGRGMDSFCFLTIFCLLLLNSK